MSNLDDLIAGGGKSFKFDQVGAKITGTISTIAVRQATNFDTGKPEVWDDGSPQEQIVITLNTELRDPESPDDDGARNVYIKGWGVQLKEFRRAVREAGGKPTPGDTFTATYVGDGEKPVRGFPPKLYRYEIVKATGLDALGGAPAPATTAPAPPAAVAAPAPHPGQLSAADKAKQLIGLGLPDDAIAAATGLDASVVAILRAA